ncbi:MAG: hypothetical protein MUE97_02775, partial [Phycisphaerales bacterium]|nr:hypothetical protein [Phycisphaerales bacterium]
MNTPLTVAKGLADKLAAAPPHPGRGLTPADSALLVRVIGRLERLSDSLLDFARARPPRSRRVPLAPLIDEA